MKPSTRAKLNARALKALAKRKQAVMHEPQQEAPPAEIPTAPQQPPRKRDLRPALLMSTLLGIGLGVPNMPTTRR